MEGKSEVRSPRSPSYSELMRQWKELDRQEAEADRKAQEAEDARLVATGLYERRADGRPGVWAKPKAERALCGAKTRAGAACQARAVLGSTRCRLHGGLSTGPKTAAGKAAIAKSNRQRGQKPQKT